MRKINEYSYYSRKWRETSDLKQFKANFPRVLTCSVLNMVKPKSKVLPGKRAKITPEKTSATKLKMLQKCCAFRIQMFV